MAYQVAYGKTRSIYIFGTKKEAEFYKKAIAGVTQYSKKLKIIKIR